MKLIEVHNQGNPNSLNVDYIESVVKHYEKSKIYMVGSESGDFYYVDESYEEVLRMIKEATKNETD